MEQFLYYLLRASVVMALFYGFYKLLFGKNTFHRVNRYLLITLTVGVCVLPIFHFNLLPEKKVEPIVTESVAIDFSEIPVYYELETQNVIPWAQILMTIFLIGLTFALIRYFMGLLQLVSIIRKSEKQILHDNAILCVTDKDISPFSWFHYIVLSHKDISEENHAIINHERAHIQLRHSLDMLFFDLFTSFFWFNPFSWLLRREIQSVHEYQSDEQVLNNGIDAKQYQLLLIRKSVGEHTFALANNFRQRDLHKRITMMMKNKTNKQQKWNYAVAIPVLFLAMVALSVPKLNAKVVEKEIENAELIAEKITISGQVVDEAGKPIMSVAITNSEDKSGTISDKEGNFIFTIDRGTTVSFVMVGYKEQKVTFSKPEKNFKVTLEKGEGENPEQITVRIKGRDDVDEVVDNQSKFAVSGIVKDENGSVVGALVQIKGTKLGTVTDPQGRFEIKAGKGDVLQFMMVGYKSFEYKAEKAQDNLVIVLQSGDVDMENDKKENSSIAIQGINQETNHPLYIIDGKRMSNDFDMSSLNPADVESISVLKNKSAKDLYEEEGKDGVIIIATKKSSHATDASAKVVAGESVLAMRGVSNDKKPLVVIDGERKGKDFDLQSVNPEDIQSISVLKDDSGVQLYGEEGKNGVIVITKKAK